MLILPAVDIDGGLVARGPLGSSGDPVVEAMGFRDAGAAWVHVVDMDRAFGTGDNTTLVRRLAALENLHMQLGGGLSEPDAIDDALQCGVARVVVGPATFGHDLPRLAKDFGPDRLAVGVDVRDGRVYARSAGRYLTAPPYMLVDRAVDAGVRTVVYRDLDRDGTLDGADLDGAKALVRRGADVILAGGIGTLEELRNASAAGMAGVIVGRALHERRFTLHEALACSA